MSRADWPLDVALYQFRGADLPYRWSEDDLRLWEALCPACRWPGWGLSVREGRRGGPISFFCSAGCTDSEVRAALDVAAHQIDPYTLGLAEQAREIAARALELAAREQGRPARAELRAAA